MALSPGTWLNHYEVLGHLGTGGMGEVYRARDNKLQRKVALKPGVRPRFEWESMDPGLSPEEWDTVNPVQ